MVVMRDERDRCDGSTWTELAAVVGDAELLVRGARELGTHRLRVYPGALHAAVVAFALHALFNGDQLPVVVKSAVKQTMS